MLSHSQIERECIARGEFCPIVIIYGIPVEKSAWNN